MIGAAFGLGYLAAACFGPPAEAFAPPAPAWVDAPAPGLPDPIAARMAHLGRVPPWQILLDPLGAVLAAMPDAPTLADLRRAEAVELRDADMKAMLAGWAADDPLKRDAGRSKWKKTYSNDFAKSTARVEVPDAQSLTPYGHSGWKTEETLSVPLDSVAGGVFAFARAVGSGSSLIEQRYSWTTRTGLGWKWAPEKDTEFVVRGGAMVQASDAGVTATASGQRSQFAVEVLYEMPVYKKVRVEYYGSAVPGLTAIDRDTYSQDLRLALPLTRSGEFYLGASHTWQGLRSNWQERSQVYIGLEFRH